MCLSEGGAWPPLGAGRRECEPPVRPDPHPSGTHNRVRTMSDAIGDIIDFTNEVILTGHHGRELSPAWAEQVNRIATAARGVELFRRTSITELTGLVSEWEF